MAPFVRDHHTSYSVDSNKVKKGVQTEMREDAEKLTKNIHEQLEHTCLRDITVVIHIIAATKSMGAKELLVEMVCRLVLNPSSCGIFDYLLRFKVVSPTSVLPHSMFLRID